MALVLARVPRFTRGPHDARPHAVLKQHGLLNGVPRGGEREVRSRKGSHPPPPSFCRPVGLQDSNFSFFCDASLHST